MVCCERTSPRHTVGGRRCARQKARCGRGEAAIRCNFFDTRQEQESQKARRRKRGYRTKHDGRTAIRSTHHVSTRARFVLLSHPACILSATIPVTRDSQGPTRWPDYQLSSITIAATTSAPNLSTPLHFVPYLARSFSRWWVALLMGRMDGQIWALC